MGVWIDPLGSEENSVDDANAICGLCLPGNCGFNCSEDDSIILYKQPVVPFTSFDQEFCPISRPILFEGLPPVSASDECRGWCSTFESCQAYSYNASANSCVFYDSPLVTRCSGVGDYPLVVDTNHEAGLGKFIQIPHDVCFSDEDHQQSGIAVVPFSGLVTAADCACFCGALSECSAFDINPVTSECRFFSWDARLAPSASCASGNRLAFLSIQDSSFPQGVSNTEKHFPCSADTSLSQVSLLSGGIKACEAECKTRLLLLCVNCV